MYKDPNRKIKCKYCDKEISYCNLSRHKKTKLHLIHKKSLDKIKKFILESY